MEMVTVSIKLSEENNDFLTEYKSHLNDNLQQGAFIRHSKESVLNRIIFDARMKFEKQQEKEGAND